MSASSRVPCSIIIVAASLLAACDQKESAPALANRRQYGYAAAAAPVRTAQVLADTASVADNVRLDSVAGDAHAFGVFERKAGLAGRPASRETPPPSPPAEDPAPGSMLVRVGQASLQVDSLEAGISRVRDVARRTGSVIANTSMAGGKEQTRSASIELRIPSQHFDEALNGLAPIGKLESVNVNVQDVGEEFVDVSARMTNAHRLEERLIDLLAKRTGKLSDVLNVEHELARVREEIERYEGRMRYLRSRTSVSTLTVDVHEPVTIVAERGVHPMRDAFAQSWRNFIGVTAGMIAMLGVLIPIGVLVGLFLMIGRRFLQTHGLRLPERASETPR